MSDEVTPDYLADLARRVYAAGGIKQPYESSFAILSGWDDAEFQRLYVAYIDSTQVKMKTSGNQTTGAKGNPLEEVARYFLEKGGIATNVRSGGVVNKWTIDGVGETHPDRLDIMLGSGSAKLLGPKVYMEAKNHAAVMGPADWAQHCARMKNHGCTFGVAFSTGGYPMNNGQGYADEIFHEFLRKVVHVLLSVADLQSVAMKKDFPWAVLKTAYIRTTDQSYETPKVQKSYSADTCLALAKSEHARLHSP